MSNTFWDRIEQYSKMGFDPLLWLTRCSNELDIKSKLAAADGIHKAGLKIVPSWFDPYFYIDGKEPEVTRRVFDLAQVSAESEVEVKRALALFRLRQEVCEEQSKLPELLESFFKPFKTKLSISCLSISTTARPGSEFAVLDYIELHRGDKAGYMPAVNATTHITDIMASPDSELNPSIAITTCIDLLNILGCGVNSSFRIFPVYDAPTELTLDAIRANLDSFTSRYNLAWEDYSSLKRGGLFYGTSAMATTTKELPTKYDQVEEGMEIMITNKFGGLAALTLRTLGNMDADNISKFEKDGLAFTEIEAAGQSALKNLSEPHFALGKIISRFCPDFGMALDKSLHIAAVMPVGAQGITALSYLSELVGSQLVINEIPLIDPALASYAAKEFLVEDAMASLNGCHVIVGSKDCLNALEPELKKHNFNPSRIGFVGKKGELSLAIDKSSVSKIIASARKLAMLFGPRPKPSESAAQQPSTSN